MIELDADECGRLLAGLAGQEEYWRSELLESTEGSKHYIWARNELEKTKALARKLERVG